MLSLVRVGCLCSRVSLRCPSPFLSPSPLRSLFSTPPTSTLSLSSLSTSILLRSPFTHTTPPLAFIRPRTTLVLPSLRRASKASIVAKQNERAWAAAVADGDQVVFVCERKKFFRLNTAMALSQTVFWLFLASFAVDLREDMKEGEPLDTPPDSRALASPATRGSTLTLSLLLATFFCIAGFMLPRRFIHTMTVLKGGEGLRIGTYTLWGSRSFETPLKSVAFNNLQSIVFNQGATARIAGHRLFFLLDGKQGRVLDAELFNLLLQRAAAM